VQEGRSGGPIEGATVRLTGNGLEDERVTGVDGRYVFAVFSGTYTLAASADGYLSTALTQVVALSGVTTTQDITLWPAYRRYLPLISLQSAICNLQSACYNPPRTRNPAPVHRVYTRSEPAHGQRQSLRRKAWPAG
jgi:hypothetical protein